MLQEQRSVYLEERCALHGCGGKVYRTLVGGMVTPETANDESYPASQAFDRCDTCFAKIRDTGIAYSAVWYSAVEVLEQWEAHTIDRATFDRRIGELFSPAGMVRSTHVS